MRVIPDSNAVAARRKLYDSYIDIILKSGQTVAKQNLSRGILNFLSIADAGSKLCIHGFVDMLTWTVEEISCRASFVDIESAFISLEELALNLYTYTWRPEFRKLKVYSGAFKCKIANNLLGYGMLLTQMGYRRQEQDPHTYVLVKHVSKDVLSSIAFDCLVAQFEVTLMEKIYCRVHEQGFTMKQVLEVRQRYVGDEFICAAYLLQNDNVSKICDEKETLKPLAKPEGLSSKIPSSGVQRSRSDVSDRRRLNRSKDKTSRPATEVTEMHISELLPQQEQYPKYRPSSVYETTVKKQTNAVISDNKGVLSTNVNAVTNDQTIRVNKLLAPYKPVLNSKPAVLRKDAISSSSSSFFPQQQSVRPKATAVTTSTTMSPDQCPAVSSLNAVSLSPPVTRKRSSGNIVRASDYVPNDVTSRDVSGPPVPYNTMEDTLSSTNKQQDILNQMFLEQVAGSYNAYDNAAAGSKSKLQDVSDDGCDTNEKCKTIPRSYKVSDNNRSLPFVPTSIQSAENRVTVSIDVRNPSPKTAAQANLYKHNADSQPAKVTLSSALPVHAKGLATVNNLDTAGNSWSPSLNDSSVESSDSPSNDLSVECIGSPPERLDSDLNKWQCRECTFLNPPDALCCEMCNTGCVSLDSGSVSSFVMLPCPACTYMNNTETPQCGVCGHVLKGRSTYI